MRKTILSSVSALALMIGSASAVMADDTTQLDTDADMTVETDVDANVNGAEMMDGEVYTAAMLGDYTASDLMDADVVDATGEDIADVSDLVIDSDNEVSMVLVDVGGFLGLGAKVVALDAGSVEVMHESDDADDLIIVTQATREDLEQMAEYEELEDGYHLQSDWDMHTEGEVTN